MWGERTGYWSEEGQSTRSRPSPSTVSVPDDPSVPGRPAEKSGAPRTNAGRSPPPGVHSPGTGAGPGSGVTVGEAEPTPALPGSIAAVVPSAVLPVLVVGRTLHPVLAVLGVVAVVLGTLDGFAVLVFAGVLTLLVVMLGLLVVVLGLLVVVLGPLVVVLSLIVVVAVVVVTPIVVTLLVVAVMTLLGLVVLVVGRALHPVLVVLGVVAVVFGALDGFAPLVVAAMLLLAAMLLVTALLAFPSIVPGPLVVVSMPVRTGTSSSHGLSRGQPMAGDHVRRHFVGHPVANLGLARPL